MAASTAFHQYLESLGIPILGVAGEGPSCRIDFAATATQAQIDQGNSARSTFNWSVQDADPMQFIHGVSDAVANGMLPVQLIQHIPFLVRLDSARMKSMYAKFKSSSPAWMSAANYTTLENLANTANMPIT